MINAWQVFNILLTAVLSVVVFGMYKKASVVKACVISMGFFVLGFYLDGLFGLIMQGFFGTDAKVLIQILGMVISKSILVTALLGMGVFAGEAEEGSRLFGKNGMSAGSYKEWDMPNLTKSGWRYYDGLTLAISAFFLLLGALAWWQNSAAGIRIMVMLLLMILLVAYYISLYVHLRKQRAKVTQSREAGRKHEAEVYLESVENHYQRTRELWHDLKNHINLMSLLLQDEKYEELKDYLRIFNEDVDSLTLPVKSGNLIVDALLTDKIAKAKREKIEVSLELCNLTGLKLKPDEICGLLGNLLDNALEANHRLREGRSLEVTCKELEACYYIRVRNPVNVVATQASDTSRNLMYGREADVGKNAGNGQSIYREGEFLRTTKRDLRNQVGHGLGLRSVERIVHGCGGEMVVDSGEKYFTVVVRIPR